MLKRLGKKLLLGLVLGSVCVSLTSCAWWQQNQKSSEVQTQWTQPATSIKALLESIQHLAASKDYQALSQHIYPYELLGMDIQAGIIYGIQNGFKSDDFAYSDPAMQRLIEQHLSEFLPASEEQRASILKEFFREEKFQFWRQQQAPQFFMFEYQPESAPEGYYDVNIVVIQEQGVYRLVFWENLDCLIRCENPRE